MFVNIHCCLQAQNSEALFAEDGADRKDKLAAKRREELQQLREKLMAGTREAVLDQFGDILNSSANKIKKTKVLNSIIT